MKAHLKDTSQPLVEGSDVTANCGVVVKSAVAVGVIDNEDASVKVDGRSSFLYCRECNALPFTGVRYSYLIIEGEVSKHREAA